jgi:hypothetical protein
MRLFSILHRGLDKVGKAIGQLTVLLLALLVVGAPAAAALVFSIVPALYILGLVGVSPSGSPLVTTILFMVVWSAGCAYIGIYIAPHVQPQIGKAVSALLDGEVRADGNVS